jgi:hypothetical protein
MECLRTSYVVSSNPLASMAWMLPVRVNTSVLSPRNFITDAIVRPSHGRPSGHYLTVCPSVLYRPRDNPSGIIFANKLQNTTSILALHALHLEVHMLFRDAEEPFVFLVPMSTKILTEDLALCFILHAPCSAFYFIVGCHPRHWVPFQRSYHLWSLQCPIPCYFVPLLSEIHEAIWHLLQREVPFIELKPDRHFNLNAK